MSLVDRIISTIGLDRNNSNSGLFLRRVFDGLKKTVIISNLCLLEDSFHFVYEQLLIFLDSLGASVENFIRRLLNQLQDAAAHLDFNGWAIVMGILLTCGWFFLRGNKIKAA